MGFTSAKATWPTPSVNAPTTMPTSKAPKIASAAVKRGHAGGKTDEERQRVDSKGEDQPAEQADPEYAEDKSDDEHGGGSVTNHVTDRAFHHHHGAVQTIAEDGPEVGGVMLCRRILALSGTVPGASLIA